MTEKFSAFTPQTTIIAGDQVVGLRSGVNTIFDIAGAFFLPALTQGQSIMGVGATPTAVSQFTDHSSAISIDWNNRDLKDSAGNTVLAWNLQRAYTSAGILSLDWNARNLIWTDGSTVIMNWQSLLLNDTAGTVSIDFGNRFLEDSAAAVSLGYSARTLIATDGVTVQLNWNSVGILSSAAQLALTKTTNQIVLGTTHTITITAPAPSVSRLYTIPDAGAAADFVLSTSGPIIIPSLTQGQSIMGVGTTATAITAFTDTSANTSIDWQNRILKSIIGATVENWETQLLLDYAGVSSIAWSSRLAYDSGGTQISYNWGARTLNNSSSTDVLNWGIQQAYTNAGALSIDWNAQGLYYNGTIETVNWLGCVLYDQSGVASVSWRIRQLDDSAGTPCFTWQTPGIITTPVVFSLTAATNQLLFGPTGGHQITITAPVPSASRTYTLGDAGAAAYIPLDTAESLVITNANSASYVLTGNGSGTASWQPIALVTPLWTVVSSTTYTLSVDQNIFVTNSSNQVLTLPSAGYIAGSTIRVVGAGAGGNFQIVSPFSNNIQFGNQVGTTITSAGVGNSISLVCFSSTGPWYVFPAPLGNFTLA